MEDRCRCGEVLRHAYESWQCTACRRPCCPACAEVVGGEIRCWPCRRGVADAAA